VPIITLGDLTKPLEISRFEPKEKGTRAIRVGGLAGFLKHNYRKTA